MTEEELQAIAGGYHGDPFAVFGPHKTGAAGGWVVRAFLPQVKELVLLAGGAEIPSRRIHMNGVFEAALPEHPKHYRFRVTGFDGSVGEMEDPYRFATVISPFDLHLFLEGTNHEAYNSFGAHLAELDGIKGTRFA